MAKITLEVIADYLIDTYNKISTFVTNQTNGTQTTKVTQETASNLNANVTSNGANLATAAKQLPDGHEVKLPASQIITLTPPAAITGFATSLKQSDGSQKTQLVDALGNNFESHEDVDGEHYLAVAAIQAVHADPNNSSTTNLSAANGYSFEGDGTSTLGVNSIQVSLYADKNCTVYVQQSPDGDDSAANWDIIDTFNYYAGRSFGTTVQAINSYVRVIVTTASLTTTQFRLQTVLCPVADPLPRALDEDSLLQTRVSKIKGDMGKVRISPMGALKVGQTIRLAGASFGGTVLDPNYWTTTIVQEGEAVNLNGELILSTGIASSAGTLNSSILVNSRRVARYIGGSPNYYRTNLLCPTVYTDSAGDVCNRRWGAFDANNGFFFLASQTNPATSPTISVVSRKNTSDTPVASGSFNGNLGSTYALDTNAHIYEIWWTNKNVYFFIDDVLLHTLTATSTTLSATLNLYVGLQVQNAGGNEDTNTLIVRSSMINRLGNFLTQPTSYYHASGTTTGVQLKTGAGNLHSVVFGSAANNTVVTLADNTTGSTPAIWVYAATGALAAPVHIDFKGLPFSTGLRLVVASGNASCTLIYE